MAEELDVSASYLNLMERNQRPITVQVLIRLADVYGVDPREFMEGEANQAIGEIEQLLADPIMREAGVPRSEVQDAAEHAPTLLAAMQRLYRAYVAAREASQAGLSQRADPDRTEAIMTRKPGRSGPRHSPCPAQPFPRTRSGGRDLCLRSGAGRP